MTRIILTRELAFASGQDAGNRSMRDANRTRWNEQDRNAATAVTNQLLLYVPASQGGLAGFNLSAAQRADLLIPDDVWARARGDMRIGHNGGPALTEAAQSPKVSP